MSETIKDSTGEQLTVDRYRSISDHVSGDTSRMRSREVAYEAVKNAILGGIFEPRERLIEERLGNALGLSRTPIREALAILEHEGLIEAVPYKGLQVRPVTLNEFLGMYEALGAIESTVARKATPRVTPADIDHLTQVLNRAEACIPDDIPGHLAACREFQRHLSACSQSPFLTRILLSIEERSDMYLIHSRKELPKDKMMASVADRRDILRAVSAGDAEAAAKAALLHADAIRTRWRDLYPEPAADKGKSRPR